MNKKSKIIRLIPIVFFGLILSCSPTVKVTTDYDHSANFNQFKTFAVYDLKAQEGQVNQLNVDRVTNAIRSEMIAKGFTESSSNPDLKVNAVSILKNKQSVTANSDFYGYGGMYRPYGYWGGGAMMGGATTTFNTYDYVDGSLVIDIVSTKSQKLVWQGIGNAQIDSKPDNPEEFIASSIKKILEGFPPGLAKK
ncbi:hypothetical protein AR687_07440 [Flavobacteriaceae bacterium CRH]|nr:hypothetical protein AR687_07440 [Flavobacteriaceae bacterium CRH]